MYIIDTSAHTPAWNKKYVLDEATYVSYSRGSSFIAGNTGLEDQLPYFKNFKSVPI